TIPDRVDISIVAALDPGARSVRPAGGATPPTLRQFLPRRPGVRGPGRAARRGRGLDSIPTRQRLQRQENPKSPASLPRSPFTLAILSFWLNARLSRPASFGTAQRSLHGVPLDATRGLRSAHERPPLVKGTTCRSTGSLQCYCARLAKEPKPSLSLPWLREISCAKELALNSTSTALRLCQLRL
ncbi:MAG: hypothetical protein ACI9EF_002401, partial [Pseudohongiellaceae bacterium]